MDKKIEPLDDSEHNGNPNAPTPAPRTPHLNVGCRFVGWLLVDKNNRTLGPGSAAPSNIEMGGRGFAIMTLHWVGGSVF